MPVRSTPARLWCQAAGCAPCESLDGHAKGAYAATPSKPGNFPDACKKLENNKLAHVPHSFRILIPRMLPELYDVRNNRNVGHVGGDVNSEAAQLVDALAEVRLPVIWEGENGIRRVLRPELKLHQQILLLAAACVPDAGAEEIVQWVEKDAKYVMRTIRKLHEERQVEFN
jgi:hypothetical protein